jgi:hypothetical protein
LVIVVRQLQRIVMQHCSGGVCNYPQR